jgi:hypothetical protein
LTSHADQVSQYSEIVALIRANGGKRGSEKVVNCDP